MKKVINEIVWAMQVVDNYMLMQGRWCTLHIQMHIALGQWQAQVGDRYISRSLKFAYGATPAQAIVALAYELANAER